MDRGRRRLWAALVLVLVLATGITAVLYHGGSGGREAAGAISYTITSGSGDCGSVSPSGPVSAPAGSTQTFRIIPGASCMVTGVLVDGWPVGPVSAYTFYNVTGNHTIVASFAADPGATVVAASDYPHPEDAAYVCDGTDDQVEIQAAIDALGGSPGRVLLLEGTYRISRSILTNHNLTLEGSGHDTVLHLVASSNCTVIGNAGGYLAPADNVTIKGLRIDGNKGGGATGHGILRSGSQATYEGLRVENCAGRGISQTLGDHTTVLDCTVRDCTGRGIFMEDCRRAEVIGNHVYDCGLVLGSEEEKAIEVYRGGDCRIAGNYVEGGGAMRQIGAWDSARADITGNTLVDGLGMGIAPRSQSARITQNTITNAGNNAIDICAADDNWIEGNDIRRVTSTPLGPTHIENSGICVNGSRATVTGNYIEFCGRAGIHIGPLHNDNQVLNNVIKDCGQQGRGAAGIWLQVWTPGAVISGTVIRGNTINDDQAVKTQVYGIWLEPGDGYIDDTVIEGNDLRNNGSIGLSPYSAARVRNATVRDNLS